MFKKGDIIKFNDGERGVMKIVDFPKVFDYMYLGVEFIDDHENVNSDVYYYILRKRAVLDESYMRKDKIKKIFKNV